MMAPGDPSSPRFATAAAAAAAAAAPGDAPPPPPLVAVAQMTSTDDHETNFATVAALVDEARARGCAALFLPENFAFLGRTAADSVAAAQPLSGPLFGRYRGLAAAAGLWLSLGGFQEAGPDPGRIYNTHAVVDAQGNVAAVYRKIHLFDADVPGGPALQESRFTAPGDLGLVSVASPAGRLGLSTCYDLRFPEVYQRLAFDARADVLLAPSAFTVPTGRAHWEVLLRARAVETQCYVAAAAQAGRHSAARESWGHAMVVDPWGDIVAALPDPSATGIAVAAIDPARLAAVRARMPVAAHRAAGRPRLEAPGAPRRGAG